MNRMRVHALLTILPALLPVAALAHPGHDHAHWASPALHALLLAALAAIGGAAVWTIARRRRRARQAERHNDES